MRLLMIVDSAIVGCTRSAMRENLPGGELHPVFWRWPIGLPSKKRKKKKKGCT